VTVMLVFQKVNSPIPLQKKFRQGFEGDGFALKSF
jgi:hypothetical protein